MSIFILRFAFIASALMLFAMSQEDNPGLRRPDTAPDMDLKPIPVFTRRENWHRHTDEISLPTPSWGNFPRHHRVTTEPSFWGDDYYDDDIISTYPYDDAFLYDQSSESGDYERHNHGEKVMVELNDDSRNDKQCASAAGVSLSGLLLSASFVLFLLP